MKEIALTQGKFTIVDDEDFEWLNQWKWHFNKGYALRNVWINKKCITILMHSLIAKTPAGMDTDHIDLNKLNNTKKNLRFCSHAENNKNKAKHKNNKSGYKGVYWRKSSKRWLASILADGKKIFLGSYEKIEDAANAYNKAAEKYHGEFSCLNSTDF